MKRYSNLSVFLHWLLVPAVLMALFMGNDIAQLSNDLNLKVDRLQVHMIAGVAIGFLFLLRLLVKVTSAPVEPLNGGKNSQLKNKLAKATHRFIYVIVFLTVLSGIGTAAQVDMKSIIESAGTMPMNLAELPIRKAHGMFTNLLIVVIFLHILAAIYHQLILKDRIFSRMWFGKSNSLENDQRLE